MAELLIRGQVVDVDIESELQAFDWTRPTWNSDKLIAASPFRFDRSPSFMVRLEPYGEYPAGVWTDSGHYDAEWASGNFAKLLSFLRNETYEEAEEYLLEQYGVQTGDQSDGLSLKPLRIVVRKQPRQFTADYLERFELAPDYVATRKIHPKVAELYGVRFDAKSQSVVLPWRAPNGRLANVKYRRIQGKTFWYEKGAEPVRNLVWGIDVVNRRDVKRAVLCEGEFDAMSWASAGIAGICVGGVNFTDAQADVLRRSAVEELLIAADNDKAGDKLIAQVKAKMAGDVSLRVVNYGIMSNYKDANDVLIAEGAGKLRELWDTAQRFDKIRIGLSKKDKFA